MKQVTLNVQTREAVGSATAKRLRSAGKVPAVIYGESGTQHLTVDSVQFSQAWRKIAGSAALIELHVDGQEESGFAVIKDFQRNPRSDAFQHVDFQEVVRGKDMEIEIPVHTKGAAYGVKNQQGVIEINAQELRVRCRPRHLPEFIEIDVTTLKVGDSIHVANLPAIENVTIVEDKDLVVVSCVGASGGSSGVEEEEATEPEVVTEKAAPKKEVAAE